MDNLESLTNMFAEFLTIYKFVNKNTIADMLANELNKTQLLEIYQLTDGNNSTRDIAAKLTQKCTHVTVANIWKKWALKGIGLDLPRFQFSQIEIFDIHFYHVYHCQIHAACRHKQQIDILHMRYKHFVKLAHND